MTAYSEHKDFAIGDFVYVLVPLGDYTQKKIILGKVVQVSEVVSNAKPFESFAPATTNLNINYNSTLDENTFVVNKDYSKIIFERHFDDPLEFLGYDTIGIKLSIYANLQTLTQKAVSGKYRIKIVFRGLDQTKYTSLNFTNYEDKVRYINMEDMIVIDPYFTAGYCNQEKTFDIKDFAVSAIIVSIVQSKADEETFLDQEGFAVSSDSFFIKTKNLYCAFGYKCSESDIETEKVYAYSLEGLRYNFSESSNKKVNARYVKFLRDTKHMPYCNIIDFNSCNGWALYNTESATVDSNFNIPGYIPIEGSRTKTNGIFILDLNNNKALLENRFIMSIGANKLLSNELVFTNNDYVKNAELLDNILGFTGKLSDNRENFNIYGLDNKLLNDYNENEIYYLIVSFNSVNDRRILPGDIISWTIPTNNTMLVPYEHSAIQYKDGKFQTTVTQSHPMYRSQYQNFQIPFKIKNIYNQNFINNTIECNLSFVDENSYTQNLSFSKSLAFGFSGSEGSEYIYNLELYKKNKDKRNKIQSIAQTETNFNDYVLEFNLYDYNMKQVDMVDKIVQYKWYNDNEFQDTIDLSRFKEFQAADRIIVARYKSKKDDKYLLSYLPIGTLLTDTDYTLEGCKTIVYDSMGVTPYYYKGKYQLYKEQFTSPEENISLLLKQVESLDEKSQPKIVDNKLIPPNIFSDELTHFSLQVSDSLNNALIEFPVLVAQGQYSSLAEYEKQPIETQETDKMEKILLGYMSANNNGLVLGKLHSEDKGIKNTIGLYNYIQGKNFFTLDETNGLIVNGDEEGTLLNLYNSNLHNGSMTEGFLDKCTLNECIGTISNASDSVTAQKLVNSEKVGLSVGSNTAPVYFSNGVPVKCSSVATTTQITELNNKIKQMQSEIDELKALIESLSK